MAGQRTPLNRSLLKHAGQTRKCPGPSQIVAQRCDMKFTRYSQVSRPALLVALALAVAVPGSTQTAQSNATAAGQCQRECLLGRTSIPGPRIEGNGSATATADHGKPGGDLPSATGTRGTTQRKRHVPALNPRSTNRRRQFLRRPPPNWSIAWTSLPKMSNWSPTR